MVCKVGPNVLSDAYCSSTYKIVFPKGTRMRKESKGPNRTSNGGLDRGGQTHRYPRADYATVSGGWGFPQEYQTADGRHLASDPLADRDFTNRPQVVDVPWQNINWIFQSGTTQTVQSATNYMLNDCFGEIIMALQAKRLVNLSNITLANPVPAPVTGLAYPTSSFTLWLNTYCQAALIMRCAESVLAGVEFNYTTSLMAAALQQQLPLLDGLCNLVKVIRVPQPLIDLIDRLSGLKTLTPSDPVIMLGNDTLSGVSRDMTQANNWQAALTDALTFATRLGQPGFNGGVAANFATDYQLIKSNFAMAYGNKAVWPKKGVSSNPAEYWQAYGSVTSYIDTVANKFYLWPQTASGLMVPILTPKKMDVADGKYMMSEIGFSRYCTDIPGTTSVATSPNSVGLYNVHNAQAAGFTTMSFGVYNSTGGLANSTEQGAAAATTVFTNTELEAFAWLPYSRGELITFASAYGSDRRQFKDLDIIKGRPADLDAATQQWCKDIFIMPIL